MARFVNSALTGLQTGYNLASSEDDSEDNTKKTKKRKNPVRSAVDTMSRILNPASLSPGTQDRTAYQRYIQSKYGPGAVSHPGGEEFAARNYGGFGGGPGGSPGEGGGWGSAAAAAAANSRAWETKKQNEAAQPGQRGIGSDAPYSSSSPGPQTPQTPQEAQSGQGGAGSSSSGSSTRTAPFRNAEVDPGFGGRENRVGAQIGADPAPGAGGGGYPARVSVPQGSYPAGSSSPYAGRPTPGPAPGFQNAQIDARQSMWQQPYTPAALVTPRPVPTYSIKSRSYGPDMGDVEQSTIGTHDDTSYPGSGARAPGAVGMSGNAYTGGGAGYGPTGPRNPTGFEASSARQLMDYVSNAEGTNPSTSRGYNEVLGYGKFGYPDKPLTSMTISEVADWGKNVLNPASGKLNSSATGRYQFITGTLLDRTKELGLDPDTTLYSPQVQDALFLQNFKVQGPSAWASLNTKQKKEQARQLFKGVGKPPVIAGVPQIMPQAVNPNFLSQNQKIPDLMDARAQYDPSRSSMGASFAAGGGPGIFGGLGYSGGRGYGGANISSGTGGAINPNR